MYFFSQLPSEYVLLSTGGVYKQVDLYTRRSAEGHHELYAALTGTSFIRLASDHSTSKPQTRWIETSLSPSTIKSGPFGRLVYKGPSR